jgi:hypothetical protein
VKFKLHYKVSTFSRRGKAAENRIKFNLNNRYGNYTDIVARIDEHEGGIEKMATGYKTMGCHVEAGNKFVCRQWAPGAQVIYFDMKIRIFVSEFQQHLYEN